MDICGVCGKQFNGDTTYSGHVCEKTGFNPTQVEHQDALTNGNFSRQAEKALERGEARK